MSGQIRTQTIAKKIISSSHLEELLAAMKRGTALKHITSGVENGEKQG